MDTLMLRVREKERKKKIRLTRQEKIILGKWTSSTRVHAASVEVQELGGEGTRAHETEMMLVSDS